jgi:hypothetical protein
MLSTLSMIPANTSMLSLIYSFTFSSLSWNIYHLLTVVIHHHIIIHLSTVCCNGQSIMRALLHAVDTYVYYGILMLYIFHAYVLFTQIGFQLTAQHIVLMLFTSFGHKPHPSSGSYNTSRSIQHIIQTVSHIL